MTKLYRVHIGHTGRGRQFRYFETIEAASKFCSAYFDRTGIVLSIVLIPQKGGRHANR